MWKKIKTVFKSYTTKKKRFRDFDKGKQYKYIRLVLVILKL